MYYLVQLTPTYEDTYFDVIEFSEDKDYLDQKCEFLNQEFIKESKLYKEAKKYCKTKQGLPNEFVYFTKENEPYVSEYDEPNTYYEVRKVKE